MIDRIKFEIKGVSLEHFITIEDKLGFDDAGLHGKERVAIKSTTYRNIRFKYFAVYKLLTIEGSLHKFCKGNNYGDFTYAEMKTVLIELSEMVDIHLSRFHVTKMEIGVNARMKEAPTEYLDMLHSYKSRPFIDMTPLAKKSALRGKRCKFVEYEIKFYDKTFDAIYRDKHRKETVPENILRYELALSRKYLKAIGMTNVTGKNLLSCLHFLRFRELLRSMLDAIYCNDLTASFETLTPDEVKYYIFVMSSDYRRYLAYLKKYRGEKEYRKEARRGNSLKKKVAPLKEGALEREFKLEMLHALDRNCRFYPPIES